MNQLELQSMAQREEEKQGQFRCRILCCASTPCIASGGAVVQQAIEGLVKERGWQSDIAVVPTGCLSVG